MSEPNKVIPKHILLVDDDPDVRDTVKLFLQLDEHTVTEAKNGREALEMFTPDCFDLVISDYTMPEMRGDELAAKVKHLAPSQPILMLTGSAEMREGSGPQVDAVLTKPFSIGDLRAAIARSCSLAQLSPA
jgi:CheY-like chemotaxis protein